MGRFEKENVSKKVKVVSQLFAVLASFGILIITLQLFSKTTGFDIFNINYSLSKLFSEETSENTTSVDPVAEIIKPFFQPAIAAPDNTEGLTIAASFLQNNITLSPIKPSPSVIDDKKAKDEKDDKFALINILSLRRPSNIYSPSLESVNYKNVSQKGILPVVKEAKFSKWSIGISLSPGITYRQLKYTNLDEIVTRNVGNTQYGFFQSQKERNRSDKALMKYSLGFDVVFRLNKKLSFQSGLVYLNMGESVLLKENSSEPSTPPSLAGTGADNHYFFEGTADFEAPDANNPENNVRFANNISYFEIPLLVNYRIKTVNEISDIELQAGASLTRIDFVTAMVYNFDNNGYYLISGSNPAVFQKYGSNAILGINYNKYITNTIQMFVNPQLKFGMTNVFNANYNIKQHYYNAGIRLGMKINL